MVVENRGEKGVHVAVGTVAQDQALIRVEQNEALGDTFDGIGQEVAGLLHLGLGPFALGDVVDEPHEEQTPPHEYLADTEMHGEHGSVLAPAHHIASEVDNFGLAGTKKIQR